MSKTELSTEEMDEMIKKAKNISDILTEVDEPINTNAFPKYLISLMKKYHTNPNKLSTITLSKSYLTKLIKFDVEVHPSKDAVINIAIALQANLDETQHLLKLSNNQTLYSKLKRDSIIMWAITHKLSFMDTEELLISNNEKRLQESD